MRKISVLTMLIMLTSLVLNMFSCSNVDSYSFPDNGKINIVASLFPQYDFAKHIAGDKANIILLLPPGTESHMFDLRPSDMSNIYNADLFLYTGDYMEPWAGEIVKSRPDDNALLIVDCSNGIELVGEDHDEGVEHNDSVEDDEDDHDLHDHEHTPDPHIWLDPSLSMKMVDNILDGLCSIDSENAEYYTQNADNYKEILQKLEDDIFDVVRESERDVLVFGGRFAYIYFLERFNLKYVTVYDSCSTNAEPSVKTVTDVTNYIKENNIPCIYHEEFAVAQLAKSIAKSTNIQCLLFSTAHNVTKTDFDNGVTFIDIMYMNLENIKIGLN